MVLSLASLRNAAVTPPPGLTMNILPPAQATANAQAPGDVEMDVPLDTDDIEAAIDPVLRNAASTLVALQNAADTPTHRNLLQYFDPLAASLGLRNEARGTLRRFLQVHILLMPSHCSDKVVLGQPR